MIEVGKLYELNGKATHPSLPMKVVSSGSWSMPVSVATNTINVSSSSYVPKPMSYGVTATVSLIYGVLCEEYVDPVRMSLKEYSFHYLNKPCKFLPNGTIGLVVDISNKTMPFAQQSLCRILIEDKLYVVFLDELKEVET